MLDENKGNTLTHFLFNIMLFITFIHTYSDSIPFLRDRKIVTSRNQLIRCIRTHLKFKVLKGSVIPTMSIREYPKVWRRFERTIEDGATLKFEIEDIPEAMWITAVEFMLGNYIREDVWWNAAGTAQDLEAVQEYRVLLTSIIRQKMSLACFLAEGDGSGHTLVGVNLCLPQEKGRFVDHAPPKTKAGLLSLRMFAEAMKVTAIYDKYGVNEYLMGAGLSVKSEYRGQGIAVELLQARMELSKKLGFKATGGIFTSAPSQCVAEKAGMECLYQVTYKKFGKQCNIAFNTETEYLKIYGVNTSI